MPPKRDHTDMGSPITSEDSMRNIIRSEINNLKAELNLSIDLKLASHFETVREDIAEIKQSQTFIAERYDEFTNTITELTKNLTQVQSIVVSNEEKIKTIESNTRNLQQRVNCLEQLQLSKNLILSNVSEMPNENLEKIVANLCGKLQIEDMQSNIKNIHRFGI